MGKRREFAYLAPSPGSVSDEKANNYLQGDTMKHRCIHNLEVMSDMSPYK
jgi:hypothetical protein